MASIESFRRIIPGADKMSDAEVVSHVASTLKIPPIEVANRLGFDDRSTLTGNELKAAGNNYSGGLYGLGEAIANATDLTGVEDWARKHREENELKSNIALQRAAAQGAVQDWAHVTSPSDLGSYVKHLGIQSAPYLAESLTGGLGARALMGGTRAALTAARTAGKVEEAAALAKTLERGQLAGSVAASYPSSVGDILSNQREQTGGKADLGSAAALGIPYAALNALGLEGAIGGRGLMRSGIEALDKVKGIKGGIARAVVAGGKSAAEEALGETGQELANQAGRIAVDPNATFTDPEALERYKQSAIGGALLGGLGAGALGGWKRTEAPSNLLNPDTAPDDNAGNPSVNVSNPNVPLQDWINQQLNVKQDVSKDIAAKAHAKRQADIVAAMNEPSGRFANDENGIERELTMGEAADMGDPDSKEALTALQADHGDAEAVAAGLKPSKNAKRLDNFNRLVDMKHLGLIDQPQFDQSVEQLNASNYGAVAKVLDLIEQEHTAKQKQQAVSTKASEATQATPNVGEANVSPPVKTPVVSKSSIPSQRVDTAGGVASTGSTPAVGGGVSRAPINTLAPNAEVSLLSNQTSQPTANLTTPVQTPAPVVTEPVVSRKRRVLASALAPVQAFVAPAAAAPQVSTETAPLQAHPGLSAEDQLAAAQATGNATELEAQHQEDSGQRLEETEQHRADTLANILKARFSKSKTPQRDIAIATAYIEALKNAPHGSKGLVTARIGQQFGIGVKAVQKIGDTTALVDAAAAMGLDPNSVRGLFEIGNNQNTNFGTATGGVTEALAQHGMASTENENAGFDVENDLWKQGNAQEGIGDTTNAQDEVFANAISSLMNQLKSLQKTAASTGVDLTEQIEKIQTKLVNAVKSYETYLKAKETKDTNNKETNDQEATDKTENLSGDLKFGKDGRVKNSYTAKELIQEIKNFIRADILGRKLIVVNNLEELLASPLSDVKKLAKAINDQNAYGVTADGVAYLIADRIKKGTGRAKFMHEVGAHLGLENLLPTAVYNKLVDQIETWSGSNKDSLEAQLAAKAKARVGYAKTPTVDQREELLAYFIEEAVQAGIDPTASGKESNSIKEWFRTLWAAFKIAVRKLGFKPETLEAQDIVNMAFGAARLEMNGSWHGTAAEFRKFNHAFMSSGEGAQAYGWGTYLAQGVGVAKKYWQDEVTRKQRSGYEKSLTPYIDYKFAIDIVNPVDRTLEIYKGFELSKSSIPAVARRLAEVGVDYVKLISPNGKVSTVQVGGPSGNLMRLDTAVPTNEMIDWDASFAEQPEVVRDFIKQEAPNIKALRDQGVNVQITSGAGIVKYLIARFYKEGGHKGSWADADPYIKMEVKKQASKYLEANGIQGIQFYDANSRENTLDNISFTKDGKTISGRNGVLQAYFTPGAIVQGYGGPDKVIKFDPVKELVTVIAVDNFGNPRRGERERTHFTIPSVKDVGVAMQQRGYDLGVVNRTRNLVIFNEKNIFRVGSETAADRQLMKFGTNASTAQADKNKVKRLARAIGGVTGQQLATDTSNFVEKLSHKLYFLHDLVEVAKEFMPSVTRWYNSMANTVATRKNIEQDAEAIADQAGKLKDGTQRVNEFLSLSTTQQKWGYDPKFNGQSVQVDSPTAIQFNKLTDEEQAVVKAVFAHGEKMRNLKKQILAALGIDKVFASGTSLQGPYAPLMRFGNYIAVLKSQDFLNAEADKKNDQIVKLQSDPKHYVMRMFDTAGQAEAFAEANASKYALTDSFAKSESVSEGRAMNTKVLEKVLAAVGMDANTTPEARTAMEKLVKDIYFQSLDEHDARQSGLKRKNISGFDEDMMRSFLAHARSEAGFLSNMKHGKETNAAFYAMGKEVKGPNGKREHQNMFNTISAHYADSFKSKETPWQDRAMAMTSAWQLSTSLGYHITNATQTAMVTVPKLASDFNDYSGAWSALIQGYKTLKETGMWGNIKVSAVKDEGLRGALQRAADLGVLDMGMDADLGKFDAFKTGLAGVDNTSAVARRALQLLRQVSRAVETANRVASGTAAYNMARKHGQTVEQAQQYAVRVIQSTQGDSSRLGSPLLLKQLPKVVGQYKKYQFTMAGLYVKAFHDAFISQDKVTRAVGRRMLGYKLFHTSVAAGVLGFPLMNLAAAAFSALGGDDEPEDLERSLRDVIGDEDMADLLLHGPLAYMGLDMSAKLGEDKIFSILPYGEWDFSSASGLAKTAFSLAGPAVSQAAKFADGIGFISRGDYQKGIEKFMPSGVASALKAFREANDGYTLKNGDVMYQPEDINSFALALEAVGMPSTQLKKMDWMRSQQYEIKRFYIDRTKQLEHDYDKAYREQDTETMDSIRESWLSMQEAKDENRKYFNDNPHELRRQPLSNLLRYPFNKDKKESQLQQSSNFANGGEVRPIKRMAEGGEVSYDADRVVGNQESVAPYGTRWITSPSDPVTAKGSGYFGILPNKFEGGVSSELSADNEKGSYPLISPTLTKAELNGILANKATDEAESKARAWQKVQLQKGQDPFAQKLGLRFPQPTE